MASHRPLMPAAIRSSRSTLRGSLRWKPPAILRTRGSYWRSSWALRCGSRPRAFLVRGPRAATTVAGELAAGRWAARAAVGAWRRAGRGAIEARVTAVSKAGGTTEARGGSEARRACGAAEARGGSSGVALAMRALFDFDDWARVSLATVIAGSPLGVRGLIAVLVPARN